MNKPFLYRSAIIAVSFSILPLLNDNLAFAGYSGSGRQAPVEHYLPGSAAANKPVNCSILPTEQERQQCVTDQQINKSRLVSPALVSPSTPATTSPVPAGQVKTTTGESISATSPAANNPEDISQAFHIPYITVSTSPYIGQLSAWDASDVLNQAGKINEDLLLLQTRQEMVHAMNAAGLSLSRPVVEISGGIEGQMVETDGYTGSSGDIDLSTAELDFHGFASDWASGFMAFSFDDSNSTVTGTRVPNSRIFLSRGFVNIGNLDETPFYGTIGQLYLPFGRYSSDILTTPVTQSLFRTDDRAAIIGFYDSGFNASIYAYDGSSTTGGDWVLKQGGINASYKHAFSTSSNISGGAGLESNMTDSDGMQNTGLDSDDQFSGFATPTGSNAIEHRVPAADAHLEFNTGAWHFAGEYISAIEDFAESDLSFNGDGALPQTLHSEMEVKFPVHNYVMHGLVAYEQTWEALGANLPEHSVIAHVHTSFWKNTVEALEFRHDIDYGTSDEANGSTNAYPDNQPIYGTGKSRNIYILQVGVYF